MEANQKFFPVLGADGGLTDRFIGIANIESQDVAEVRKGYERVIRPRFADAKFFFDEDLKQGLASMNAGLEIGHVPGEAGHARRQGRARRRVGRSDCEAGRRQSVLARTAAELSKADLQSRLVNEFPELQGIAGRITPRRGAKRREVATAIDEAYMPRFSGDAMAPSKLGQVLAIAERLDTLAGGSRA